MVETRRVRSVDSDAVKAYIYSKNPNKGIFPNRNPLKHEISSYGIAVKWLIHKRGLTYATFAKRFDGTTRQNINYFINQMSKESFEDKGIDKVCKVLCVSQEYFMELCEKIEEKMQGR